MSPTHLPVECFNFAIDGAGVYSRLSTGGPSPLMCLLATRNGAGGVSFNLASYLPALTLQLLALAPSGAL